jgi:hypothetical protein
LRYGTDQRQSALVERFGRNHKNESRAALFGALRGMCQISPRSGTRIR